MELSSLISPDPATSPNTHGVAVNGNGASENSPVYGNNLSREGTSGSHSRTGSMDTAPAVVQNGASQGSAPKAVKFVLVSSQSPQFRARLAMRVNIFPHDETESIVTTVKNFYGLYSDATTSRGVSFEDENGMTLIASYENFKDNMTIQVRVHEEPSQAPAALGPPLSFSTTDAGPPYSNGDPLHPLAAQSLGSHISRPGSRTSRKRSLSPGGGRGRRSASANTNSKARSRSSRTLGQDAGDSANGYSSGDGAPGSVSSKSKEQIGNTEISVENIVEGGRRKRAKFESSVSHILTPLTHISAPARL
jgi:hypothetical protein